jgi:hypothetical protein
MTLGFMILIGCSSRTSSTANSALLTSESSAKDAANAGQVPVRNQPVEVYVEVPNPRFLCWEKHPVGTMVSVQEVSQFKGQKTTSTTTYQLLKKTDFEVVVEMTGQIVAPDGTPYEPTKSQTVYTKTMNVPESQSNKDFWTPPGTTKQEKVTITILGKNYTATKYKSRGRVEAGETLTETWIVPELPHGIVKTKHEIPASEKIVSSEILRIETQKIN